MIVKCLRHQVPFLKTFSRSELTQPALRLLELNAIDQESSSRSLSGNFGRLTAG